MTEEADALVAQRLKRALESLEEAEALAATEHWVGCVNRQYYACFYAVIALLLQHGYSSPRHSGVRGLFNLHMVRTGLVSTEIGEIYNR